MSLLPSTFYRDNLSQHQDTDNDQEIEMCSPMPLVTSPQASLFADRHPFAVAKPSSTSPPDQQYGHFRVSSFDGAPVASVPSMTLRSNPPPQPPPPHHHYQHHTSYEQPVVLPPEPIKVYRKSPFLPRKKSSPESNLVPKKESKLSTLGAYPTAPH